MIFLIILSLLLLAVFYYLLKSTKSKKRVPYEVKLNILQREASSIGGSYQRKNSNHTYRGGSHSTTRNRIDMSNFTDVISFDKKNKLFECEANIKVCDAIEFLLKQGYNLVSCPDLKELTLGGLISGIGGGNTSHLAGYFHTQLVEFDAILPGGRIVTAKRGDDLFHAIPFTLGTIGYLTRLKMQVKKAKPYVESRNIIFTNARDFYSALTNVSSEYTFCDSTIYSKNEFVLVLGKYIQSVPADKELCNVVNRDVYYEEIRKAENEFMYFTTQEFIYRFSTDLYYTSLMLPKFLRSRTLRKMIPKSAIEPVQKLIGKFMPVNVENICHDVLIPASRAHEFFEWYDMEVGLYPLYNVPVKAPKPVSTFWPDTQKFVDFGVGYGVMPKTNSPTTLHDLCRKIEKEMLRLGGRKLPYTDTHISEELFWKVVFGEKNKKIYDSIRKRWGSSKFPTVYDKIKSRHLNE